MDEVVAGTEKVVATRLDRLREFAGNNTNMRGKTIKRRETIEGDKTTINNLLVYVWIHHRRLLKGVRIKINENDRDKKLDGKNRVRRGEVQK